MPSRFRNADPVSAGLLWRHNCAHLFRVHWAVQRGVCVCRWLDIPLADALRTRQLLPSRFRVTHSVRGRHVQQLSYTAINCVQWAVHGWLRVSGRLKLVHAAAVRLRELLRRWVSCAESVPGWHVGWLPDTRDIGLQRSM